MKITPTLIFIGIRYMLAIAAMAYLTRQLVTSLQADIFGSLPHVGLWFAGLLFVCS